MFSCVVEFKLSIPFCIRANLGIAIRIMKNIANARTGSITKSTDARLLFMENAIMIPPISIPGERTAIISPILVIFIICVISLVRRVIKEPAEKLSISLNENSCTLSNTAFLKSELKFTDAFIAK